MDGVGCDDVVSVFVSMTPDWVVFYDLNNSIYLYGKAPPAHPRNTQCRQTSTTCPNNPFYHLGSDVDGVHLHSYIAPVDPRTCS
ncbi:MAG: hypothetical protein IPO37_02825 [Saprospiraceae bacterium]|nr:hypothetical protein [Saprospiraceae bacterium]